MTATEVLAQAMREYGQAVRGDWSDLDGRSVLADMENFASAVEEADDNKTIEKWREELGICLNGGGHWCGQWSGYCAKDDPNSDNKYRRTGRCNCPCTDY